MPFPDLILSVMEPFRSVFSRPTWQKVVPLAVGTILARGRRTVTAALRSVGLGQDPDFSKYHQALNRAAWSARQLAGRLLRALTQAFVPQGTPLTLVIDEALERRWGARITKRGHYRDPLASSRQRSVSTSGLRWVVLALVAEVPRSRIPWALPSFSLINTTPEADARAGRRHKTLTDWARQMIAQVRRWLPQADLTVVGDQTSSAVGLGLSCTRRGVRLIAPLRMDARLFDPPPPRRPGAVGRPRVVGRRQPKLSEVLLSPGTAWESAESEWYGGRHRQLELASGTALWHGGGRPPLAIRWVLSRDPAGKPPSRAYFSTRPGDTACGVVAEVVKRWPIETTFEESRAHLGIETQRQWSDRAIERETPCLFGLYSLVALLGQALHPEGGLPRRAEAWYRKAEGTFADVLAVVRRRCWSAGDFLRSCGDPDLVKIPRKDLDRLMNAVCYSH